jgi:hypothetical protein
MDTSPKPLQTEIDQNLRRHNHLDVCLSGVSLLCVCVCVCMCPYDCESSRIRPLACSRVQPVNPHAKRGIGGDRLTLSPKQRTCLFNGNDGIKASCVCTHASTRTHTYKEANTQTHKQFTNTCRKEHTRKQRAHAQKHTQTRQEYPAMIPSASPIPSSRHTSCLPSLHTPSHIRPRIRKRMHMQPPTRPAHTYMEACTDAWMHG